MESEIFSTLLKEINEKRPVALAVIVSKLGSGPREPGAKMLILSNGKTVGTIGGGSFERLVVKEALKALKEGKPRKVKYVFRRDHIPKDAIATNLECGGEVEVFIDVIKPKPRVIIVGAGHIGKPVADLANLLGYRVVIVDDKSELASKDRFPYAEKIVVDEVSKAIEKVGVTNEDYVVIVYGGVEEDYSILRKVIEYKPRYIGLLGSKRKITLFLKRLREEGVDVDKLKGILYAPVGIDINAVTPEEIAVSIMAEIIGLERDAKNLPHLTILK